MRFILVSVLLLMGGPASAERPPEIPNDLELINSGTCFIPDTVGVKVYCEVYQEMIGGRLHFWERIRLASTDQVIQISWWEQFGPQQLLWRREGFFNQKSASP